MLSRFSEQEIKEISEKRQQYAVYVITLLYPWSATNPLPFEENMSWWQLYLHLDHQNLFSSFALNIISNIQAFYDNFLEETQEESFIANLNEVYMHDENLDLVESFHPVNEMNVQDSTIDLFRKSITDPPVRLI